MLENLDKEEKLYKSWNKEADQLGQDENLLEIREPYDEEEENEWREKHRNRVKQERLQASNEASNAADTTKDDDLWQACSDSSTLYKILIRLIP